MRRDSLPVATAVFALGVLLAVELNLLGRLFGGELLLAAAAVLGMAENLHNRRFWNKNFTLLAGLFLLSLLAYVCSDLIRSNNRNNALRGWAREIFTLFDMIGFYVISRRNKFRLPVLVVGMAFGELLTYKENLFLVEWKYYLSLPTVGAALGLIAITLRKHHLAASVAVLVAFGFTNALLDSRAGGGVCFLAAAMLVIRAIPSSASWGLFAPVLRGVSVAFLICLLWLSVRGTQKPFENRRDLSLAFRSASVLTALSTIRSHPLLGIGSWTNTYEGERVHQAALASFGVRRDAEIENQAGHSAILQSWVEAGFLGAAVFLFYLGFLIRCAWKLTAEPFSAFTAFATYQIGFALWHCLFSPYLGSLRIEIGFAMAVGLAVFERKIIRIRVHRMEPGESIAINPAKVPLAFCR